MAEKIVIAELDINTEGFLKSAQNTKAVLDSLKKANQQLKKSGKESSEEFVKNEVAIKRLTAQYTEQKNVLVSLNEANTDFVETSKAVNTAVNKNVVSIAGARKNNKELLAVRNQLNLKTVEGRKALIAINSKLDANNQFIKENVDALSKQKMNIGNYQSALSGLNPTLQRNLQLLVDVKNGLVAKATAIKTGATATGKGTKALKLFRLALISTGIGAIVVALGTLISAFASTQKGIDAINKALAPLKGAFQGIIGVIQEISLNVFGQLKDRWTVASNAILVGIDLIRIGWNKITGDVEEANEIQAKMKTRIDEAKEAQIRLNKKTEDLKNIFRGAGDEIRESMKAQQEIARLTIAIEKAENRLIVSRSESMKIIKAQNKIAEDVTKSLKEREDASRNAVNESKRLLVEEQNIIDLKIKQMKLAQSQNDTDRASEKELAELQAERNNKETAILEMQTTLTNKLNIIRREGEAKAKKASDERLAQELEDANKKVEIAVEVADRELEIYKRNHQSKLEANEFFTEEFLAQEVERLNRLAQAEKDHQAVLLENGKISQIEYNQAIEDIDFENQTKQDEALALREEAKKEKEAVDLDNKRLIEQEQFDDRFRVQSDRLEQQRQKEIQNAEKTGADVGLINQKYHNRQIELVQLSTDEKIQANANALGQIAGFLGEETALGKLAGIAQATMNIQIGITKALASKGFAGIVEGGIIASKGAIALGKIAGVQDSFYDGGKVPYGTGGKISGSNIPTQRGGDNILATVKSGEVILNEQQQARAGGSAFFKSIGVPGFESGGVVGVDTTVRRAGANGGFDVNGLADAIAGKINMIKVVAIEEEITSAQNRKVEIIDGANI